VARHPHLITAPTDTPWVFYCINAAPLAAS
jgi:hypothetical protein